MPKKKPTSIRWQLTCLVLACVSPVWAAVGYLVFGGYAAKCEEVNRNLLDGARSLSTAVDRELCSVQGALIAFVSSPSFGRGDFVAIRHQALELLQLYPGADIIVVDRTGRQLVNSYLRFGAPLPKRNNLVICQRIFREKAPVIGDLFFGTVTKRPLVSVDVPVMVDGKVLYDLSMTFPADRLAAILAVSHPLRERYVSILDGKQQLVVRSTKSSRFVGRKASPLLSRQLLSAKEGVFEMDRNLEGKPVFVSFSRSSVSNWAVVVGVPKATVRATLYQWLAWAFLGAAGTGLFSIALAVRFGRGIAQAIRALVAPALGIGSGEIAIQPGSRNLKETDEVAQALYQAAALLQVRDEGLRISEKRYLALFENRISGVLHGRMAGGQCGEPSLEILKVNETFARLFGSLEAAAEGSAAGAVSRLQAGDAEMLDVLGKIAIEGGEVLVEGCLDGWRYFSVHAYSPLPQEVTATFTEMTDQKWLGIFKELGREVVQFLTEPGAFCAQLQKVPELLKSRGMFDTVGLRLKTRDDFPIYAQDCFSKGVAGPENPQLSAVQPLLPANLACLCGLVLSGRLDPGRPDCTERGSYWTNDLANAPELGVSVGSQCRCSGCRGAGDGSLALVPISSGQAIFGVIQLSTRRPGRFSADLVEALERVAANIGGVLARREAEKERSRLEEHLQQVQKMESVGRLAGGVAHDFNNMLGVIIGYADLALLKMKPSDPLYQNVSEIQKAAERSAELTRQLLAFARKQTVTRAVVRPDRTVEGILVMLRRVLGEDVSLKWQPEAGVWPVKVDPSQMEQILVNLCVNARDAIDGTGVVTIQMGNVQVEEGACTAYPGVRAGTYVRLAVCDTGCGMDKETLSMIFEPFFTTKRTGKGTGLGLATVYGAVQQNSGHISVYSEPGVGSTFTVLLPRYEGEEAACHQQEQACAPRGGNETILLVEDEEAIRSVASQILSSQGYAVLSADSPKRALELAEARAGGISLLLTDVIMPEMNGRELAQELRSRYPGLKLLFMSGFTADVIANQGVIDEGVHFIQKPFSVHALSAKVREVIDLEGAAG